MTTYSKPPVMPAWGETATPVTDLESPETALGSTAGDAFVKAGWTGTTTPPARQYFNWILNFLANAVRYFMQRGVVSYDAGETYQIDATVLGPDGLLYASLTNGNIGNTPASSPSQWGPIQTVTPTGGDNSANVATTSFVHTAVAGLAPLASPTFTGTPAAPTPATADSTTKVATTAFVHNVAASLLTRYESGELAVLSGTLNQYTVAHGQAAAPFFTKWFLRCKTAELGYSVGDEVDLEDDYGDPANGYRFFANATNLRFMHASSSPVYPSVRNASTGTPTQITGGNWKVVARAAWM